MKFATKLIQHCPPRLRHVATLPWEIKLRIFSRYSAESSKVGTFFETQCTIVSDVNCYVLRAIVYMSVS